MQEKYLQSVGREMTSPLIDRFNAKYTVDEETGCWEWTAAKNRQGYGTIQLSAREKGLAHRVSYELFVEPIPDKLCALHHCDNPGCVNPEHLFLGTRRDNAADMMAKGRHQCSHGENHPNHKLSDADVAYIRKHYEPHKVTAKELATKFNVNRQTVWRIARYVTRQTGTIVVDK